MKKSLIIITIVVSLLAIIYLAYVIYKRASSNYETPPTNTDTTPNTDTTTTPVVDTTITYDETPATKGATYFEKIPIINGQQTYIAYPLEIDSTNPPILVVFSHGSNTLVTTNMSDQFMKDLRAYGKFFTAQNFAFAASNMHGANWGSAESVSDMKRMIDWVRARYKIKEDVNLLAHSMGGLPSFNFTFSYPKLVNCIALLAPTSESYSKTKMTLIKDIPIQIWHGDKDVNVPLSLSTSLKARYNSFGFKNLKLTILPGKDHWTIDTELKNEILGFYKLHE